MTNQQPPTENNDREFRNLRQRVWQIIKNPRNQIIALVGLGTIVTIGYVGTKFVITKVAPKRIEKELEKILARDVILGEVTTDPLNRIIIDGIVISPTAKDKSYLDIEEVRIHVNLWSLLWKGRVLLDIVADDIKGYAQLDTLRPPSKEKKPLPDSFLLPALPITTQITLQLQDSKLLVNRNANTKAIAIDTQGKIEFLYDSRKQPLSYNLKNRIGDGNITVKGETLLSNTQSKNQVKIKRLDVPDIIPFLPELPVEMKEGIINGNFKVNLPSLLKLKESTAKGKLKVSNLTGKVNTSKIQLPPDSPVIPLLNKDFSANLDISFKNQSATIAKADFNWGEINTTTKGKIDLQKGYSLQANLKSLSLAQMLSDIGIQLPIIINGLASSDLKITGEIDNPIINGNLNIAKSILDKLDLGTIKSQFTASLNEVEVNKITIQPTFGGEITSQAFIQTNLKKTVLAGKPFNLDESNFNLKFSAKLPPNQVIQAFNIDDYGVNFNNLIATGEIKGTLNKPQGLLSFAIPNIQADNFKDVKAEGKLVINQEQIEIVDTQLVANNNQIQIKGNSDLKTQNWQFNLTGKNFNLTPFLAQFCNNNPTCLATEVNTKVPIILTRLDSQFQGNLNSPQLEKIEGKGGLNLQVAQGNLDVETSLNKGNLMIKGKGNNIALQKIFTALPTSVDVVDSNINLTTNIPELLASQQGNNIPNLDVSANLNGKIANGNIRTVAEVKNGLFTLDGGINNISLSRLLPTTNLQEDNLDANFSASASLQDLSSTLPIQIKQTAVTLGENVVQARGNLDVVNLFQKPDINNLRLEVDAQSQFETIIVSEIFTTLSQSDMNMLPKEINLDGDAKLLGVVTGNNLLTNPLGENGLNLLGDVSLTNFKIDRVQFEPILTGKLVINPQSKISLDLRGKRDVINLAFVKDSLFIPPLNATLPYTPQNIEIRQGGEGGLSLLASRQGNNFVTAINNFTLDGLQLQPAANFGINGTLTGVLSTEISLNLNDFSLQGDLNLVQPAIDFINVNQISAGFAYQDNIATVTQSVIKFGDTEYNLAGKFNLQTQDIQAKVDLKGDMIDIFNTLKISDFESLTSFAQQLTTRDAFAQAQTIPTQSIGEDQKTIASKVNLLTKIDQQIKAIARQIRAGTIPNNLNIYGDYQGEILLSGNIKNPIINFDVTGYQWHWLPQQNFPNIVEPLGLVVEQSEFIAIRKVSIYAVFQDNNLSFKPLFINVNDSEISLVGDISAQSQNLKFKIHQFPLDLATRFVPLPIDLETSINLEATIKGRFINPDIEGVLTLENTAIEGAVIEEEIVTDFNYRNYELALNSVSPEHVTVEANLPYNLLFDIERPAFINLEFDDRSKKVISILTGNKVNIPEGKYTAKLNVEIESISQLLKSFDLEDIKITGNLDFQETKFTSSLFEESALISGNINLSADQIINVDNLLAKVNQTDLTIQGSLPVFKSLPNNENLLTVNVPNQSLSIEGLYSGNLNADIKINGTAFKPQIGGYLTLNNGDFSIPSPEENKESKTNNQLLWNQWLGERDSLKKANNSLVQPNLDNFILKLENSNFAQWGLYRFLFGGELSISGPLLDIDNLSAEGIINLRRGQIYLGGSSSTLLALTSGLTGSQTTFYLSRTNENKITFNSNDSILNPRLDIQVKADIIDYSRQIPSTQRNEVSDPIIRTGRGDNIQVVLDIDGELAQLLPVLSGSINRSCNFPVDETITEKVKVSSEKLESVEKCVNLAVLNPNLANVDLLSSPIISLSSTPNRSEGEIINLIVGGKLLEFASQLQNLSTADLLQNGLIGLVLVPIANNITFGINERVSTWGQPLGMDDVRIFPLVEGVYRVKEEGSVSISYDYIYSEAKVRFNIRF